MCVCVCVCVCATECLCVCMCVSVWVNLFVYNVRDIYVRFDFVFVNDLSNFICYLMPKSFT